MENAENQHLSNAVGDFGRRQGTEVHLLFFRLRLRFFWLMLNASFGKSHRVEGAKKEGIMKVMALGSKSFYGPRKKKEDQRVAFLADGE